MNRNYRGFTITRIANAQMACAGNLRQGARFYYVITQDDKKVGSWVRLADAKTHIDQIVDYSEADRNKFNALRAQLLNK